VRDRENKKAARDDFCGFKSELIKNLINSDFSMLRRGEANLTGA